MIFHYIIIIFLFLQTSIGIVDGRITPVDVWRQLRFCKIDNILTRSRVIQVLSNPSRRMALFLMTSIRINDMETSIAPKTCQEIAELLLKLMDELGL